MDGATPEEVVLKGVKKHAKQDIRLTKHMTLLKLSQCVCAHVCFHAYISLCNFK